MREARGTQFRYIQTLLIFLLQSSAFTCTGWAGCYSTPQAAVDGVVTGALPASKMEEGGYKVVRIQKDELLRRTWAMVINCDHPDWSSLALPAFGLSLAKFPQSYPSRVELSAVVHAGDVVHLWRREALLQIEITGVAEESGSLGKPIRVRSLQGNPNSQSSPEEFTGVVQGPLDVEMNP